jgi:thiamine-monophosphate kinase
MNGFDETEIIDLFCKSLINRGDVVVGAGVDDCAVIDIDACDDEYLVMTTDMLHRRTDFPEEMSPYQIGWMTTAVSLSDIAAMGATPQFFMVAIGIPPDTDIKFIDGMSKGMSACVSKYGVSIVGGDTDRHDELTLVGFALGKVKKELLARRKGAKAGDLVCVTGELGDASACLAKKEKGTLAKALFEPEPRVYEGIALAKYATSMADISDSLAISLHDLSIASDVGFAIDEDKIPISDEIRRFSTEEIKYFCLYGGGDFELLFTIDPNGFEIARKELDITAIGEVIQEGIYLTREDKTEEIERRGFQHFRSRSIRR